MGRCPPAPAREGEERLKAPGVYPVPLPLARIGGKRPVLDKPGEGVQGPDHVADGGRAAGELDPQWPALDGGASRRRHDAG